MNFILRFLLGKLGNILRKLYYSKMMFKHTSFGISSNVTLSGICNMSIGKGFYAASGVRLLSFKGGKITIGKNITFNFDC